MTVSLMAARLLVSAFKEGDFTGWPDFVKMDDGVMMSQMFLSVSKRRMVYSVLAKAQDPSRNRCIFVLCIDQVAKGMENYHNKVGIMDVLLSDDELDPKLVLSIDYGEHIVLDAVKQPAVRSVEEAKRNAVPEADEVPDEGPDGGEGQDDRDGPGRSGVMDTLLSAIQRRRDNKVLVGRARAGSPPRGRIGVRRGR